MRTTKHFIRIIVLILPILSVAGSSVCAQSKAKTATHTFDPLPEVDQPRWNGNLGYHIRTGKHSLTRYDWEQYLDFADLTIHSKQKP
jgi:hypothetical protein